MLPTNWKIKNIEISEHFAADLKNKGHRNVCAEGSHFSVQNIEMLQPNCKIIKMSSFKKPIQRLILHY